MTYKFKPGHMVATPGALKALEETGEQWTHFVHRHLNGDWGELSEEDELSNIDAVINGDRILSAYHLKDGTKIWVITEADRSSTTVLLPDEY